MGYRPDQLFRPQSIADVASLAFAKVFKPGSWNPVYEKDRFTFNGEVLEPSNQEIAYEHEKNIKSYYKDSLIQITGILGISNKCPLGQKPTLRHILNNTIFSEHPITVREVFNTLMLIFVPIFTLYNLIRLITEFFPYFFADAIEYFSYRCEQKKEIAENTIEEKKTPYSAYAWSALSFVLSNILLPVLSIFKIIMRATTSPGGFVEAYESGAKIGGPFLGVVLAALSLIITGATLAALTLAIPPIGGYFNVDIAYHITDGLSKTPALLTFLTNTATFFNVPVGGIGLFFYGFLTGFTTPLLYLIGTSCGPDFDNKFKISSIQKAHENHQSHISRQPGLNTSHLIKNMRKTGQSSSPESQDILDTTQEPEKYEENDKITVSTKLDDSSSDENYLSDSYTSSSFSS